MVNAAPRWAYSVLFFVALTATYVGPAAKAGERPNQILNRKLADVLLSDRAKNAAVEVFKSTQPDQPWDIHTISLELIVGLDQPMLPNEVHKEFLKLLNAYGLSFSLNQLEISGYRASGRVPSVTIQSRIGRLNLTPMAFFALRSQGIETLEDLSRAQTVKVANLARGEQQVPTAKAAVGDHSIPEELLGLTPRTRMALVEHGVKTLEQLATMTEHELRGVHSLGALGVDEIRRFIEGKGFPWYRDKLEKAIAENVADAPLDVHFAIPWRLTQHWKVTTLKQLLEKLDDPRAEERAGGQTNQTALQFKKRVDQYRAATCAAQLNP